MSARNDEIFRLREDRGLSYGQIARRLGISRGAVAGVLRRGGATDPESPKAYRTPRPRVGTLMEHRIEAIELGATIGWNKAARCLGIDRTTLWRWRAEMVEAA